MQKYFPRWTYSCACIIGSLTPLVAYAHEIYVLSPQKIAQDKTAPALSLSAIIAQHRSAFFLWGFVTILTITSVFFISIVRKLEKLCDPFLFSVKTYAPTISRVAMGCSYIAGGMRNSVYGPELSLPMIFGAQSTLASIMLIGMGILLILRQFSRATAICSALLFAAVAYTQGWYVLTYASYWGETCVLFLLDTNWKKQEKEKEKRRKDEELEKMKWSFTLLRVSFGLSLIYSAYYAKILHGAMALDVINTYHLTQFLHFEPHFLLLGAAIIEIVLGVMFVIGVEIRFASAFFIFWLLLSVLFFKEAVWPHIILLGIPLACMCHGYDRWSVTGYFFSTKKREPVF